MGHKVCLIIDGWTAPILKTSYDDEQIELDNAVFTRIRERITNALPDVKVESLIGKGSSEKIAMSELVDYHVTNASTGSLYTSRIARKKGFMHIANGSRAILAPCIHYNSPIIPSAYVTDDPDDKDKRADHISYFISPEKFIQLFLQLMSNDCITTIKRLGNINTAENSTLRAYTHDPMIIVDLQCWNRENNFEFLVKISSPLKLEKLRPRLYVDCGNGYYEHEALKNEYSTEGEFTAFFPNLHGVKTLRFDPFENIGDFALLKLSLTKIA
jgi:hypothetical protein